MYNIFSNCDGLSQHAYNIFQFHKQCVTILTPVSPLVIPVGLKWYLNVVSDHLYRTEVIK